MIKSSVRANPNQGFKFDNKSVMSFLPLHNQKVKMIMSPLNL